MIGFDIPQPSTSRANDFEEIVYERITDILSATITDWTTVREQLNHPEKLRRTIAEAATLASFQRNAAMCLLVTMHRPEAFVATLCKTVWQDCSMFLHVLCDDDVFRNVRAIVELMVVRREQ